MERRRSTATVTTFIAGIVAVTVFISLPLGFFTVSYQYLVGSLETETDICAELLSRYMTGNTRWREGPKELEALLEHRSFAGKEDSRRIVDRDGKLLAEHPRPLSLPVLMRRHDLETPDHSHPRLEIRRSLHPLMFHTILVALFGLALGVTIFVTLRVLPLRAVRRAETSRRRSERRYRTLFEESKDAVLIASPEGTVLDANSAAVDFFGFASRDEMTGSAVGELLTEPLDRERLAATMAGGGVLRDLEFSCRTRNGRQMSGLMTVTEVRDPREETATFNIFCHDQTNQKRIEQQLLHSQKMEAVGVLAGGVAHDFNSIITIISGFAELVRKRVTGEDPLREYVEGILTATKRASHLVKGLLTFSRNDVPHPQPVDLNRLIRETGKLLAVLVGEKVQFSVAVPEEEMMVLADREFLHQMFMNLVANARDAMPEGGTLTIGAAPRAIDESFVSAHGFGSPGMYAAIFVKDTGRGMSREVAAKIFEPFFTTKEVGEGTGLGLSIVYGIVKQHDGFITVESEPEGGTVFTIFLPLLAMPAGAPPVPSPVPL